MDQITTAHAHIPPSHPFFHLNWPHKKLLFSSQPCPFVELSCRARFLSLCGRVGGWGVWQAGRGQTRPHQSGWKQIEVPVISTVYRPIVTPQLTGAKNRFPFCNVCQLVRINESDRRDNFNFLNHYPSVCFRKLVSPTVVKIHYCFVPIYCFCCES